MDMRETKVTIQDTPVTVKFIECSAWEREKLMARHARRPGIPRPDRPKAKGYLADWCAERDLGTAATSLLVWVGVLIACSGGMILIWLYSTEWFLDFAVFGVNMRDLFQVRALNLSVAVWVGFIALLGIATDDGVVVASYLDQSFSRTRPTTQAAIREATVQAG